MSKTNKSTKTKALTNKQALELAQKLQTFYKTRVLDEVSHPDGMIRSEVDKYLEPLEHATSLVQTLEVDVSGDAFDDLDY